MFQSPGNKTGSITLKHHQSLYFLSYLICITFKNPDKCSSHSLSRKLLATETIAIKYNQSKGRIVEASPNGHAYKTLLYLSLREHSRKRGRKTVRVRERIRGFSLGFYILVMSEATLIKSQQHDCLHIC